MRFCKYCGTQMLETDSTCPNCGKELGRAAADADGIQEKTIAMRIGDITKKVGKYPKLLAGIAITVVCVAVVLITMNFGKCKFSGCSNKAVSGSGYCYSHKCAVSTCNNSRFSYSNYCYSHYLLYDDDADTYTNRVYSYELNISNVTLSSNSSYTIAEGTITNNSDQTVSYVKIKGSFETSSGSVIDTDWTYAVGSEGLDPGESCKWRMSVSKDRSIKNCTVTILDFDY